MEILNKDLVDFALISNFNEKDIAPIGLCFKKHALIKSSGNQYLNTTDNNFYPMFIKLSSKINDAYLLNIVCNLNNIKDQKTDTLVINELAETFTKSILCKDQDLKTTIIKLYTQLPKNFQTWFFNKSGSITQLKNLSLLSECPPLITNALLTIADLNCSLSSGIKALNLIIEIYLINSSTENKLALDRELKESEDQWISRLNSLRAPKSSSQSQQKIALLDSITWPKTIRTRLIRQGDHLTLSTTMNFRSPDDIKKQITQLLYVCDTNSDKINKVWNS